MRQFEDWRFTKGAIDAPQEYIDYILCAHIYHCTPSDLDNQPAFLTGLHFRFWSKEQEKQSGKKATLRGKRKRGKN